jgi:hypothetical protein
VFAFFAGCALGALIAACIGAPFLAPWPVRLRYLLTAQVADPVLGLGPAVRLSLREVTLTAVEADRGHVELALAETGPGCAARPETLTRDDCPPSVIAQLDGWLATRTPLLRIADDDDEIQLYGPDGAVLHLDRAPEKIA